MCSESNSRIPRTVQDLSSPPSESVNDGIKIDTSLDAPFKLLVEFINLTGVGSLIKGSSAYVKGSLASTTSRLVAVKE